MLTKRIISKILHAPLSVLRGETFDIEAARRLFRLDAGPDPEPDDDGSEIRDLIAFFNERVDLEVDGVAQTRPLTQWSR